MPVIRPRAILFDVFGTCVTWQDHVSSTLQKLASAALNDPARSLPTGVRLVADQTDWSKLAGLWRMSYLDFTTNYFRRTGDGMRFKTIDESHKESLLDLLSKAALDGLFDETDISALVHAWHTLPPHPDTVAGLHALNQLGIQTATLSNGNRSLQADLCSSGSMPFTHRFSAEDFGTYKPDPKMYLGAVEKLGMKTEEVAMCAAHLGDLEAAKECGLRAFYVERQGEEAWSKEAAERAEEEGWVEIWVDAGNGSSAGSGGKLGFEELARRLEQA